MFAFFCIELIKVAKLEIANLEGDEIHWMLTFCPPTNTFWASALAIETHQIRDYKRAQKHINTNIIQLILFGPPPLQLKDIRSNYVNVIKGLSINNVKVAYDSRFGHLEETCVSSYV